MKQLFALIERLKQSNIHFELKTHRDHYIMLEVAVPGERWEIEMSDDGSIEIEIFTSDGSMFDEGKLSELFTRHTERQPRD